MSTTKRQSWQKLDGEKKRDEILRFIIEYPSSTRYEIATWTNNRVSSVCGRTNELLKQGTIYVSGEREDYETKMMVETLSYYRP